MALQKPPGLLKPTQIINIGSAGLSMVISRITKKPTILGNPVMLMIEPGTACQLSCPHCPTGRGDLSRPSGRLTFENFRKIWDSIKPIPVRLQLWNQGEPLTNVEICEIIRYATKSGSRVVLSTNVELLARGDLADRIVASGLQELILSLDGATDESYKTYRIDGDFSQVEEGVRKVVEAKKRLKLKTPVLIWQFIMFKHNLHEMDEAKRLTKQWGLDRIVYKTAQLEDLSIEEGERWLPENPRQRRYHLKAGRWSLRRRKKFFCDRLYSSAVILWDGTVVPCCFDKDGDFPLGNVLEKSFDDIWKGKKYREFRQEWINGNRPSMCDNCTEGLRGMYFRD